MKKRVYNWKYQCIPDIHPLLFWYKMYRIIFTYLFTLLLSNLQRFPLRYQNSRQP